MKSAYSTHWKSSKNPRKQRKYQYNAPLHTRGSFFHAPLSKELRKKYNTRSVRVRKGDKVAVMRGQFKGKTGSIDRVDLSRNKIFVAGVELSKKDGSKTPYPLHASNVMITTIGSEDKRRFKSSSKTTSEE
ncbi:MAG: 50S ribosomal protein L24 [Nanobdellota archaeon]